MSTNTALRFYNARIHLLDQIEEIGYDVTEYKNFNINMVDVMNSNNQMDMIVKRESDNKKIYVHFFDTNVNTFSKKHLDELTEELFEMENVISQRDTLIIIINDEPNDTLSSKLKYIWEQNKYMVIVHNIKRLQYNIMKHKYVSNCSILNESEVTEFKKTFNIRNDKQLPEISRFDPQALVVCLRPGDIIKFNRKSETAMNHDYYRICVN